METILAIATLLGGLTAAWFIVDKVMPYLKRREAESKQKNNTQARNITITQTDELAAPHLGGTILEHKPSDHLKSEQQNRPSPTKIGTIHREIETCKYILSIHTDLLSENARNEITQRLKISDTLASVGQLSDAKQLITESGKKIVMGYELNSIILSDDCNHPFYFADTSIIDGNIEHWENDPYFLSVLTEIRSARKRYPNKDIVRIIYYDRNTNYSHEWILRLAKIIEKQISSGIVVALKGYESKNDTPGLIIVDQNYMVKGEDTIHWTPTVYPRGSNSYEYMMRVFNSILEECEVQFFPGEDFRGIISRLEFLASELEQGEEK